jgi:hypothetical protein
MKERTFVPSRINGTPPPDCKNDTVSCNDGEVDTCVLSEPDVDCLENRATFKIYYNRKFKDDVDKIAVDEGFNNIDDAMEYCVNNNCKYIEEITIQTSGEKMFVFFGDIELQSTSIPSTSPIQYNDDIIASQINIHEKCGNVGLCVPDNPNWDYWPSWGKNTNFKEDIDTKKSYSDNCPEDVTSSDCTDNKTYTRYKKVGSAWCVGPYSISAPCPACSSPTVECTDADYEPCPTRSDCSSSQGSYSGGFATLTSTASCNEPSTKKECPAVDCSSPTVECTDADYLPCPSSSDCSSSQGSSPEGDAILRPGVSCTEPSSKKRCPAVDCSCVYSSWGRWTPSTDKTCGTDVPQERTRSIDRGNDSYCTDKLIDDTLTPSVPCPCPISTAGYTTLDNNKQYRYYTTYKNWTRASKQCMDNGAKLITAKTADDKRILEEIKERCSPLSGTIWLGAIKHDDVYDTPNDRKRYKWIDSDTEYVNSSGLEWRTGEPNGDLHQGVYEAKIIEYNSGMNDTKVVDFENRFICMKEADGSATMTQEAIDFTNGTTPTPTPTPLRSCSSSRDYRNDYSSRNLCRDKSCANTGTKYKKIKKSGSDCEGDEEIEVNCPPRSRACTIPTSIATVGSFR